MNELLIVAGEASGDAHGAALVRELRRREPDLRVVAVGGDLMAEAGAELIYHYSRLAVVGITEVITHLGDIRRAMNRLLDTVKRRRIRGVVLIDYPDFNMTLARRLRRRHPGLPIVYYISPQVWAWRSGRVRTMARLVDRMMVILPFEKALYEGAGVETDFVGHPLLDEPVPDTTREEVAAAAGVDPARPWLGLLPGSRAKEVERLLPTLAAAAVEFQRRRDFEVVIPRARGVPRELFERCLAQVAPEARGRLRLLEGHYHALLPQLRVAAVCSGTATLETALAGTPMVVVYRTSWLTYNLGKLLVRIPDIALANVVAGRRGVPELLQGDVTPANIARQLGPLAEDGPVREECLEFLGEVCAKLGEPGASGRAAEAVLTTLRRAGEAAPEFE